MRAATLLLVLLLAGCTGNEPAPDTTTSPSAASTPATSPATPTPAPAPSREIGAGPAATSGAAFDSWGTRIVG